MNAELADLITAAATAAAGTGALMAAGAAEAGAPWAPFNTMAAVLLGEPAAEDPRFQVPATPIGLAIIVGGLAGWGLLYRESLGRTRFPASLLTGALFGGALYLLDYHILPERLQPGFERYLSGRSIALKYIAIALALAMAPNGAQRA